MVPNDPSDENQNPNPQPPRRAQRSDGDPSLPPGHVLLSEAEHNRIQAEHRQATKRLEKLEQERADRERQERIEAEKAAGRFDAALREEQEARRKAEERAERVERQSRLNEIIVDRGFVGERAAALRKLVDLNEADLEVAVDATIGTYPALFALGEPAPSAEPQAPRHPVRRTGPSTPPAAGAPGNHRKLPEGYVSPEEYMETPMSVRYSPAFRARVEASRPHWPNKVPASTFAQTGE